MLRIQGLTQRGRPAPQYDLPEPKPTLGRQLAEVLVSGHFGLLRTQTARWLVDRVPFGLLGRVYVGARAIWKGAAAKKYKSRGNTAGTNRRSWTGWWRVLGPLLLLVMLWRVGPERCWSVVRGADPLWFLGACALSIPALAVKALRWQEIVRAIGGRFSFGESMGVYAAGMLAGAVTPGKIGDLAKAPLLAARGVPLSDGIVVSLLDRILDGAVLLALGFGGILTLPALPGRGAIAVAAGVAMACTAAAALVFRGAFSRTLRLAGPRWWGVMVATTIAALAPYFGSAWCCAKALGLSLSAVDVVAGSSVAAVLALLPVSVAGIGTRDAAFVLIFAQRGINAEQAIALSSLILAWMLVNCVLYLAASRLCHRHAVEPQVASACMGVPSHESVE